MEPQRRRHDPSAQKVLRGLSGERDDFDVVRSRYLPAGTDDTVPLAFLVSGTDFARGRIGFGVAQVPWHCETRAREVQRAVAAPARSWAASCAGAA